MSVMAAVGNIQQLASSLSNLGSELSSAAPNGDFASVLSQVNSELAEVEDGGQTSAPDSTSGASTDSLLGAGSDDEVEQPEAQQYEPTGSDVVSDAEKYLGVPYVWGGTSPTTGFDCSGLVQHVYGDLGVDLPRTSEEQAEAGTPVASLADAQPGDLVFFAGSDGTATSPGHVGVYIGNGMMIDAPHTGADVRIEPVGNPVSIRRILPDESVGSTSTIDLTGTTGLDLSGYGAGSESAGMASLGVPASLEPMFESAGQTYGLDPLLLASVAKQESGFQTDAVSSAGAVGLMQLMPATAAGLGVDPTDPSSAIDGAAQLLSGYLSDYGGSVPLALAAYNAGPGAVSEYGGVPPYGQTQNYVSDITSMLSSAQSADSETEGIGV
jgi:cell wall-associated NlpC family hydrolase